MVARILSDDLLHLDSKHFLGKTDINYVFSPEELLARAFTVYYIMNDLPENERFVGKGLTGKKIRKLLTPSQWKTVYPNDPYHSFIAYMITPEFNQNIQKYPRIRNNTFLAIQGWIYTMKSNPEGNGFM
jgi:hypothetical protein